MKPLYVTKPALPPLDDFLPLLREIWDSGVLTNGGPFHERFEHELAAYLGVRHLSLFTNGTIALVTALQALRITGEVITTPYSFVATAHALLWNGIKPVFVDIDPETLNLSAARIEAAITPQTTAILPVHCYGTPCDVKSIERIADTYGLRVIYDAAHAFGVRSSEDSVCRFGDLSVLSFHATKVFNTFEGGAIVCPDAKTKQRIDHLKNFGFVDEVTVAATGINGKMSEFNAALGIVQLRRIDSLIEQRRRVAERYMAGLAGIEGLRYVASAQGYRQNHAYFPLLVTSACGSSRDAVFQALRAEGIYARRYFYPLISEFPMYRGLPSAAPANLPQAHRAASQIICLPIYPDLENEQVDRIVDVIRRHAQGG